MMEEFDTNDPNWNIADTLFLIFGILCVVIGSANSFKDLFSGKTPVPHSRKFERVNRSSNEERY